MRKFSLIKSQKRNELLDNLAEICGTRKSFKRIESPSNFISDNLKKEGFQMEIRLNLN